jgi:hypothetical protein
MKTREELFNSNDNKMKFCNVNSNLELVFHPLSLPIPETTNICIPKHCTECLLSARVIIVGKRDVGLEKWLNSIF